MGDRSKGEYENALDSRQQTVSILLLFMKNPLIIIQAGGFETPAENGTLTNFVEMGQARDKILSLKLDQVRLVR